MAYRLLINSVKIGMVAILFLGAYELVHYGHKIPVTPNMQNSENSQSFLVDPKTGKKADHFGLCNFDLNVDKSHGPVFDDMKKQKSDFETLSKLDPQFKFIDNGKTIINPDNSWYSSESTFDLSQSSIGKATFYTMYDKDVSVQMVWIHASAETNSMTMTLMNPVTGSSVLVYEGKCDIVSADDVVVNTNAN